ncbi:MAG TPA: 2-oxo acid dehydrogenase subunit E2 [Steroidobacteraceae bacterium]|jgi:pyruvate dehydrogenase E2 component (dihydrolipoamide acetyltransferase)|nr:2-oxo acid dehydrogenase subunit E2 [Steroidobacteraceae bacterium]
MSAAANVVEVRVPDLGSFKDVAVIDVMVKPGDSIEVDTPLVTLESDKAAMDVPSTASGVVEKIHATKGGKVNTGDLLATLKAAAGTVPSTAAAASPPAPAAPPPAAAPAAAAAPAPSSAPPPPAAATPTAPAAPAAKQDNAQPPGKLVPLSQLGTPTSYRADLAPIDEPGFSRAHAGPSVRKFARELGVDLARVAGQGFKGRITHEDVKAFVKSALASAAPPSATAATVAVGAAARSALPAVPVVDYSQFGPVETQPLTRIQRISGPRLQASWVNIPHVTQFDEADITELEELRAGLKDKAQAAGVKLTPLAFIMRACVKTLLEFPRFNAALDADGANLIVRKFIHMGFAADTPNGLVVPVVKDAHRKDVYELARQLAQLSEKSRAGKLPPTDMQGGCFTISSLGGIGGTAFTPIINAPEVAILGVSRSSMRPVYRGTSFVPRLMLPLSLSYDHRVIDGAMAARFTTYLAQTLAEPRSLLEAVL